MHRPERWGYVQFSADRPGQAAYRPDPSGPIRHRLMQIYHAQAAYHERTRRWAGRLDELALPEWEGMSPRPVNLRATDDGFVAAITFTPMGGARQTWTVRQDSRIRREDEPPR
jgi:hypothetical protein